jgi:hypothetical protein
MQQKDHAINNEDPDFLCTTEDEDGAYSEAEGNETAPGSSKKKGNGFHSAAFVMFNSFISVSVVLY